MGALEDDYAVLRGVKKAILQRLGEIRAYAAPTPSRHLNSRELLHKLNLTDEQILELRRRLACR